MNFFPDDSNNTDLGEKTTLMACRFDSFKDILRKWNLINKSVTF